MSNISKLRNIINRKKKFNIEWEFMPLSKNICVEYYDYCLERGILPNPEQMITFLLILDKNYKSAGLS